jgi:hypothetical protein
MDPDLSIQAPIPVNDNKPQPKQPVATEAIPTPKINTTPHIWLGGHLVNNKPLVGNYDSHDNTGVLIKTPDNRNIRIDINTWKKFATNDDRQKIGIPLPYAQGGIVYANNGMLVPYQPKGTDTVPAMLTPGEFVVNRAATQKNLPLLKSINNGSYQSMGGMVYLAGGGTVKLPDDVRVEMTPQEARKARGKEKAEQAKQERDQKRKQATEDRETKETDRLKKWADTIVKTDGLSKITEIDKYKIRALRNIDEDIFKDTVLGVKTLGLFSARELTEAGTTSGLILPNIRKLDDETLVQLMKFGEVPITLPNYTQTSQQVKDHLLSKGLVDDFDFPSPLVFPDIDAASFKETMTDKGLDANDPQDLLNELLNGGAILGPYASNIMDIIEQKLTAEGASLDRLDTYMFKSGGVDAENLNKLLSLYKNHALGFNDFSLIFGRMNEELAKVLAAYGDDISYLGVLGLDQMYKTLSILVGSNIKKLQLPFKTLPINNPDLKGPSVVQLLSQFGGTLLLKNLTKISTAQLKVFEQAGTHIIPDLKTLLGQAVPPQNKQYGGLIYASEGTLVNYQPRGTDTVPAMLTPGEFVVNRAATQRNLPLLKAINSGNYENGGIVYLRRGGVNPRAVVPTVPINDDPGGNPVTFDTMLQQAEDARRGRRPRQDRQDRQDQRNKQKERLKNIFKLPPIGKLLINEIMLSPNNFDLINANAINETLAAEDIKNKIKEKLDSIDEPEKQRAYFVSTARSYLNRYRLLLGWYANSKKAKDQIPGGDEGLGNKSLNNFVDTTVDNTLHELLDAQITNAPQEGMTIYNTLRELIRDNANLPGFEGEKAMNPAELDKMIGLGSNPVMLLNQGGVVYAKKGMMVDYRPKGTDTIPAMLTPGEFVVNKESAQDNLSLLTAINSGNYANGGSVKYLAGGTAGGISFDSIFTTFSSGLKTSLTTINAAISEFLGTIQNDNQGVNNNSGSINLDAIGQFTAVFARFVDQLQKINIPPQINVTLTQQEPIRVQITGSEALQQLLNGPLGQMISSSIKQALNREAINNEEPTT